VFRRPIRELTTFLGAPVVLALVALGAS